MNCRDLKRKTVALVGLKYHNNMGDALAIKCTEKLIRKNNENIDIIELDMYGRDCYTFQENSLISEKKKDSLKKIIKQLHLQELFNLYKDIRFQVEGKRNKVSHYFKYKLKNVDAVVIVAAGTIKYDKTDDFSPYYDIIIKTALKYNIPCAVSAAGVESTYNPMDSRCRRFIKALNYENVRLITCRDNVEELQKYVKTQKIFAVSDPAVWSSDFFANNMVKKDNVVGISVITFQRFVQYGSSIDKETYEKTIINLISYLDSKKIDWKMFSNGHDEDTNYAIELCEKAGFDSNVYVIQSPRKPEELVSIISKFSIIVTSRLHACIVAYSLGIPFIAFKWSPKIELFADRVGLGKYVVKDNRTCYKVEKWINEALSYSFDDHFKNDYKDTIEKSICKFIEESI